jgi:hypothetical protein
MMGMCDSGDTTALMEFRNEHYDLWREFVKADSDYCPKTAVYKEYCNCEACKDPDDDDDQ